MIQIRILYQDDDLIIVDKPTGIQVHPPERATPGTKVLQEHMVKNLRLQTGKYIYPVHRLDRATSGVMVFAFSSEVAALLQGQFQNRVVEKKYVALVRGWFYREGSFVDDDGSETYFSLIHQFSLPEPVGKFSQARYSLVLAKPLTGKYHQIRRHLKSQSHPIVGDTVYGDGKHNQLWRRLAPSSGLYLKAYSLVLNHPITGATLFERSRWGKHWHRAFDLGGFCPILSGSR
jgi:tRNA pseudouridine65 synthase